jgi:DNA-binding transcriptional ArsR family regulator
MGTDALDPVIHTPARLRIVATLKALPDGDTLSFTRLRDMLDPTPGDLITHLRKLEDAGYLTSDRQREIIAHLDRTHTPGPRRIRRLHRCAPGSAQWAVGGILGASGKPL